MKNLELYITYMKRAIEEDIAGNYITLPGQFPFMDYSDTVSDFIQEFHESELIDLNYAKNFDKMNGFDIDEITNIFQVSTKLTYIVRTDRFNEGFLKKKIEDGTVFLLLQKYSTLI